jgi:hypothetical protein
MEKAIGIGGAFFLVVMICVFVKNSNREKVVSWLSGNPIRIWALVASLLAYNSLIALVAGSFNVDLVIYQAVYFFVPTAVVFTYSLTPFAKEKANYLPLFVILALWLPIELRLMMKKMEIGGVGYPYVAACAVIYGLLMLSFISKHDIALELSFPKSKRWLARCGYWLAAPFWVPVQASSRTGNPSAARSCYLPRS